MVKKYLIKSICILCVSFFIFCGCKKTENATSSINFLDKCVFENVDDNWIYYFCTSFLKDENGNFTILNEYDFNGVDLLKKDDSDEFKIPVIDGTTGEIMNYYIPNTHLLLYGMKTRAETKKINEYFNSSKFNFNTVENDLKSLNLENINTDLILRLYERNLLEQEKEFGKYGNLPFVDTIDKELSNGIIRVGYILYYGDIQYIKIDFISNDGKFLSELVKENNATVEQIADYNEILKIEQKIIEEQKFEINIQYEGEYLNFSYLYQILKGLQDKQ